MPDLFFVFVSIRHKSGHAASRGTIAEESRRFPPSFSNGLSPTPVGCHGTVGSRTEPAEENSFSCGLKLILIRQPAVSRMAPESILTIGTLEMIDPHFPPCLLLPAAASES
jgi:hypothetical protein